jgi:hypothetical protein
MLVVLVVLAALAIAPAVRSQEPVTPAVGDTAVIPRAVVTGADTVNRPEFPPPISPRRAFLYSAVVPGMGQTLLGRPRAAGLFVLSELIAAVMIRETGAELREARALVADSVFLTTRADGTPLFGSGAFTRELVRARQAHLEDWIAFLLANHLFAGLDAYVAAHLWDVPLHVGARPAAGRFRLTATFGW